VLDDQLGREYADWLSDGYPAYEDKWRKLSEADREAALFEAAVWKTLRDHDVHVEPWDLQTDRPLPDFRCNKGQFYVEATCIKIETATRVTGVSHKQPSGGHYAPLNPAIYRAAQKKAPQCAKLDAPALVAVGTFHWPVSAICLRPSLLAALVTGMPKIAWPIDKGGKPHGEYQFTDFENAPFLRPFQEAVSARECISGMLICGFGCSPPRIAGIRHCYAVRPFDPHLLKAIPFCELHDADEFEVRPVWRNVSPDW